MVGLLHGQPGRGVFVVEFADSELIFSCKYRHLTYIEAAANSSKYVNLCRSVGIEDIRDHEYGVHSSSDSDGNLLSVSCI